MYIKFRKEYGLCIITGITSTIQEGNKILYTKASYVDEIDIEDKVCEVYNKQTDKLIHRYVGDAK